MEVRPSKSSVYTVRAAEDGDLPAIADIYNDAVLNSTATFDTEPATLAESEQWLRDRSHPYAVLVAERGGEVVGWAALKPFASKPAYRFTAENTVYVVAANQGASLAGYPPFSWPGGSMVVDFDGRVLAQADPGEGEKVVVAPIDIGTLRHERARRVGHDMRAHLRSEVHTYMRQTYLAPPEREDHPLTADNLRKRIARARQGLGGEPCA